MEALVNICICSSFNQLFFPSILNHSKFSFRLERLMSWLL